ncbi:MAG: endonuclease/exonuclease/phosphatase family protein [bacterium]|nr:endonuclease/exonuclease/phosphatase family protein [bacterium]
MRKFICTIIFLALLFVSPNTVCYSDPSVSLSSTTQIRIGTFNIEKLGKDNPYQVKNAAIILKNYDIVAIQEVMNTGATKNNPLGGKGIEALQEIVAHLGEDWDYVVSPEPNGTANAEKSKAFSTFEYYAFLYRKSKIELVKDSAHVWNESENKMSGLNDQERQFDREPFIASFRAKDGNFDFTIITIHAASPAAQWRKDEIGRLVFVYKTVQDSDESQNDVFLMGDFNTNVDKKEWDSFKSLPNIKHVLISKDVTTLDKARGRLSKSQYDTMWYQDIYSDEDIVPDSAHVHRAWEEDLQTPQGVKIPKKIKGRENKGIWLYGAYASDHLPLTVLLWNNRDADNFEHR